MPTEVKYRRGSTADHSTFTGAANEMTVDTTKNTLVVHDGSTIGGFPLALESEVISAQSSIDDASADIATQEARPLDNMVINGGMAVWQRGTSFTGISQDTYTADMWAWRTNAAVATGVVTIHRTTVAPPGSPFALEVTVTTADTSLASDDWYFLHTVLEGFTTAELGYGTATAKAITLSFYVTSHKTGTHCVALRNSSNDRAYIAEYTVNSVDTWEKKEITIPGATDGTWNRTNGIGISIFFAVGVGSGHDGAADTWLNSNALKTTNQVNVMDTVGNRFRLCQVKAEVGEIATDFIPRSAAQELALCQRYFEWGTFSYGGDIVSGYNYHGVIEFKQQKRVSPTISYPSTVSGTGFDNNAPINASVLPYRLIAYKPSSATVNGSWWTSNVEVSADF